MFDYAEYPQQNLLCHFKGFSRWGFDWPWQMADWKAWFGKSWQFAHVFPEYDTQVWMEGYRLLGFYRIRIHRILPVENQTMHWNRFIFEKDGRIINWNDENEMVTTIRPPHYYADHHNLHGKVDQW